jgi:hypothetical protein
MSACMLKYFGDLIGRTVEAYVDDIMVKSKQVDQLVDDLEQTFASLKGVQRVTGCLAALSCFILHLGERGLPLYRLLRKTDCFAWTTEA